MTLATHAITGAAIASVIPEHPVAAFVAGFASHFLLDAIPHYDYPIYSDSLDPKKARRSLSFDRTILRDGFNFSLDAIAGLAVSIVLFANPASIITILSGAVGGMLPDPLQFVSKIWGHEPLTGLQRFHKWIHTSYRLRESGRLVLGIVSQLAFVGAAIIIAKIL